jgi:hypothetical protein
MPRKWNVSKVVNSAIFQGKITRRILVRYATDPD